MKRSVSMVWCGLLVLTITACMSTELLPARFMTAEEAFPSSDQSEPPAGSEASNKSVFNASYEEVFRASSVSAPLAMLQIQKEDKHSGVILATRSVSTAGMRMYFYSIRVKELGRKRTEVTIVAKLQGKCTPHPGIATALDVATVGMVHGALSEEQKDCEHLIAGLWAEGKFSSAQEMSQFMIMVRNNLVAAGVL
jgi:hypothetical protein